MAVVIFSKTIKNLCYYIVLFFQTNWMSNCEDKMAKREKVAGNNDNMDVLIRVLFYISSLMPLSILLFLRNLDIDDFFGFLRDWKFYIYFATPILSSIILFVIYQARSIIDKNITESPIQNIESQDFNFSVAVSIYFIPFITSSLTTINDWLVILFVVIFMGILVIKTNFQYLNPFIAIFGLGLYKGMINNKKIFVISKSKLNSGEYKTYNKIAKDLYKIN